MESNNGLIYAMLLDGSGGARRLDWAGVNGWTPEQGFLWMHLNADFADTRSWLAEESGLEAVIAEALLDADNNPRCVQDEDALLATFRGVNFNRGSEPEDMVFINFWIDGKRALTVRSAPLQSTQDMVRALEQGKGPRGPGMLLVALLDRLHERMEPTLDEIEVALDDHEKQVTRGEEGGVREGLLRLRNEIIELRRHLAPQRTALFDLGKVTLTWFGKKHQRQVREVEGRMQSFYSVLDSYRERSLVIKEELNSLAAERMNRSMHMLSIVTGVFLPLGFITGLLGINVGGMPGVETPVAFWIVCVLLAVVAGGSILLFKAIRWI